jgi:Domain of unknown function (DUF4476)
MVKTCIVALLLLIGIDVQAQRNHFIAIQSENKQPFYARVEEKIFNSSARGHLIIPKLIDSTYIITIGFPKDPAQEQKFPVTVNKDAGFILKNLKEKGWVLSNSQTAQLIMPVKEEGSVSRTSSAEAIKKDSDFLKLMAQVVNDSAVMENIKVEEEPKKAVVKTETTAKPSIKADSSAVAVTKKKKGKEPVKSDTTARSLVHADSSAVAVIKKKKGDDAQKKTSIVKTRENKDEGNGSSLPKPFVKKLSEQKTDSAMQLVYEDVEKNGVRDTVEMIILFDSGVALPKSLSAATKNDNTAKDTASVAVKKNDLKENTSGNAIVPKDSSAVDTANLSRTGKEPLYRPLSANVKTNCKNTASDHDVDQLRVKMLAIDDDDDKITVAKKIFKSKCFSTNQVKALSEVFSKDDGKYKLFDAVYPYVSDADNFIQLQGLLKDEYYIYRFKAMIRQ